MPDPTSDDRRPATPPPPPQSHAVDLSDVLHTTRQIEQAIGRVIEGKPQAIRLALTVLLAEGHLLIEDVPGVGKTMLAKSMARAIESTVRRIQFTHALMQRDVTDVSVFNPQCRVYEYNAGGVWLHVR